MQHYFGPEIFCRSLCRVAHRNIRARGKLDSKCGRRIVSPGVVAWATSNRWTRAIRFAFDLAEYKASLLRERRRYRRRNLPKVIRSKQARVWSGDENGGKEDVRKKMGDDWDEGRRRVIALSKDWEHSLRSRSQKMEKKIARVYRLKLLYRIS